MQGNEIRLIHRQFDNGGYKNMFIDNSQTEIAIQDRRIRGVSFTGSTAVGKIIGGLAGKNLKKCVLELGGSDPFIVLEDADLDLAVEMAYASRMACNGQACINAKRFIIHRKVYDDFRSKLVEKIKATTVMGDPLDSKVNLGPVARQDLM
jgi:succinate-semialdehyde dehydrogenase/glutarate-semialdehyde dehydrogenase